jgi:hypothetical protein
MLSPVDKNQISCPFPTLLSALRTIKWQHMAELTPLRPAQELIDILLPAFGPCPAMQGNCHGHVRWCPEKGDIPRGFRGGTGRPDSIELVLVCAEPGDAYKDEHYCDPKALDKLLSAYRQGHRHIESPRDSFAKNIREILKLAFPKLGLAEQLQRTWITEAVLCSARKECGRVPSKVERECVSRYLVRQLRLLPNARIVALGRKAWRRLQAIPGVRVEPAFHPAHRRKQQDAIEPWKRAVKGIG